MELSHERALSQLWRNGATLTPKLRKDRGSARRRAIAGTTHHCCELVSQAMEEQMVAPMMIKEHMEVLGSDGVHVGTVDHLEGQDQMKLTKTDTDADGEHHFIPLAWVDRVDKHVHLKQSGAEAKARWKTH